MVTTMLFCTTILAAELACVVVSLNGIVKELRMLSKTFK